MLGNPNPPVITADSPCPTCKVLTGALSGRDWPYPDCKCPDGFEDQVVEIKKEDGTPLTKYRFCKPKGGTCEGKKVTGMPPVKRPPIPPPPPPKDEGWGLLEWGTLIGVGGLLVWRYKSLSKGRR